MQTLKKYAVEILLSMALLLSFWTAVAQNHTASLLNETRFTDADIAHAVKTSLRTSTAINAGLLLVSVHDGIVVLTGMVPCMVGKERAADLCRTIRGVRAVVDRLEIEAVQQPDRAIEKELQEALAADAVTARLNILATVKNGMVTLKGNVSHPLERQRLMQTTECVRGIRGIKTEIDVKAGSELSDEHIRAAIYECLADDAWIDEGLIVVRVRDGHVSMSGAVGSVAERNWAENEAMIDGVRSVSTDELDIAWWAGAGMRTDTKSPQRSDNEILNAVREALLHDIRVPDAEIKISVQDAVVSLQGTVATVKAKTAAEEDASNTIGIRGVVNHIEVLPPFPIADAALKQQLQAALRRDNILSDAPIRMAVENGSVMLTGAVDMIAKRYRFEDTIARIEGVKKISNELQVLQGGKPLVSDQEIRQALEKALRRNGRSTDQISIGAENNVIQLTGEVENWHLRKRIERMAYYHGARTVINELQVRQETAGVIEPHM